MLTATLPRLLAHRLRDPPARRGWPVWTHYAATVGLVLAAYAARLALDGVYHLPFLTFIPAILAASLLFDRGSGLLATILSAALASRFLDGPGYGPGLGGGSGMVALAAFVVFGLFTAALIEAFRAAVERLVEAERRARACGGAYRRPARRHEPPLQEQLAGGGRPSPCRGQARRGRDRPRGAGGRGGAVARPWTPARPAAPARGGRGRRRGRDAGVPRRALLRPAGHPGRGAAGGGARLRRPDQPACGAGGAGGADRERGGDERAEARFPGRAAGRGDGAAPQARRARAAPGDRRRRGRPAGERGGRGR